MGGETEFRGAGRHPADNGAGNSVRGALAEIISRPAIICLLLALVTLWTYRPVLKAGFTSYDDPDYVTANPHVLSGITTANLRWALFTGHADNWHPLTWVSHMLDCQFFGTNAPAHHLVNVLLHVACAILLFLWLKRAAAATWRSAFVAALFALHPLHVQSVAWIAERKDVLSTLFWMLTMGSYTRYANREGRIHYFIALLCFALGLMAKPMLVTVPCVLLLLDYWPLKRFGKAGTAGLIIEKVPFFLLSAAVSAVTVAVQKSRAMGSLGEFPLSLRLENAAVSYLAYIGKTVWPAGLAVIYPYHFHPLLLLAGAAALSLALITGFAVVLSRQRPYLLTGWLWFFGTLIPVIGIVQVGAQGMADRYDYVPSVGLFILAAWGSNDACNALRIPLRARALCAAFLLAACAWITRMQLPYWHDSIALFEHAIQCTTGNNIAQDMLGKSLADEQRHEEAIGHYNTALQIFPSDPRTWNNLGISLLATGRLAESIHASREALRIDPDFEDARNNLAVALSQAGRKDEAIGEFTEVLRRDPDSLNAHYNLANLYMDSGRLDDALAQYSDALRLNPGSVETHCNIAMIELARGKAAEAVRHYAAALQLKPDELQAMNGLAWIYATSPDAGIRDPDKAVSLAEVACRLTEFNNAGSLDILAAAYANAQRFQDAVRIENQALEMAGSTGQTQLAGLILQRLALYKSGHPYRAAITTEVK